MIGQEFETILVICTRQIGDVLLTTPLIRAARQRWPRARIDVLGFAGTLGMLAGNPDIAQLIEVPATSTWFSSLSLIRRLWRGYDLALITQRSDRAHLYGWVAARTRAGLVPGEASLSWWKKLLVDHPLVIDGVETAIVREKIELLAPWVDELPPQPVVVPPAAVPLPRDLELCLRDPMVVVHVPSMWRYKQWPSAHYRALLSALLGDGVQVVLTGSTSPADQAQVAAVRDVAAPPALVDASGRLELGQITSLLRRARLYIGPDTSITHLAAASGVPVIALFGPTNPQVWGPWPQGTTLAQPYVKRAMRQRVERVILMQGPGDCVPCFKEGCEGHRNSRSDCLEGLSPQRVIDEARAMLSAAGDARPQVHA